MKLSKILLSSLLTLSAAAVVVPTASVVFNEVAIVQAQEEGVVIRRHYTAAHGDKAFTAVSVLLKGDTIIDVVIDEFQFGGADSDFVGVPNSDSDFGSNYAEGKVLFSKLANNDAYSALMTEKAGSTVSYADNFKAIVEAVKGKTVEEVNALIAEVEALGENDSVSDVVSGATLVDTAGYLHAVVEAVEEGAVYTGVEASENTVLKQELSAPHGTKSFALVTVALDGETIVASAIDEFQIGDAGGFTGVPNSDAPFGEGLAEGKVLFSKVANDEAYSALMADKAGSTVTYLANLNAISAFANGKTVAEVEAGIEEVEALGENDSVSDVVSGATLVDTAGYLHTIVEVAAK